MVCSSMPQETVYLILPFSIINKVNLQSEEKSGHCVLLGTDIFTTKWSVKQHPSVTTISVEDCNSNQFKIRGYSTPMLGDLRSTTLESVEYFFLKTEMEEVRNLLYLRFQS